MLWGRGEGWINIFKTFTLAFFGLEPAELEQLG